LYRKKPPADVATITSTGIFPYEAESVKQVQKKEIFSQYINPYTTLALTP